MLVGRSDSCDTERLPAYTGKWNADLDIPTAVAGLPAATRTSCLDA